MTDEKHPLPQSGGSYVRQPDGTLVPAPAEDTVADERPITKKGK